MNINISVLSIRFCGNRILSKTFSTVSPTICWINGAFTLIDNQCAVPFHHCIFDNKSQLTEYETIPAHISSFCFLQKVNVDANSCNGVHLHKAVFTHSDPVPVTITVPIKFIIMSTVTGSLTGRVGLKPILPVTISTVINLMATVTVMGSERVNAP